MHSATNFAQDPVSRIPAWKRLGLKLKSSPSSAVLSPEFDAVKRKRSEAIETLPASKKTKKNLPNGTLHIELVTPSHGRKKSVTFTPETKIEDGDSIKQLFNSWLAEQKKDDPSFSSSSSTPAFQIPEAVVVTERIDPALDEKRRRLERVKKPKQKKAAEPHIRKTPPPSTPRPFLQYLRQYHESRSTWKFNKNHQNHLLKYAFDVDIVPSDHVYLLYEYIKGLQGGVRDRLRDTALAIKVKDVEEGQAVFPAEMPDKAQRQREYEASVEEYIATMTASNAVPHVGYEEGLLLGLSHRMMQKRVSKRTRTEAILAELAATSTSITDGQSGNGDDGSQKRVRLSDGPQKTVRKRKQRTAVVEEDSSDSSSNSDDSSSEDDTPIAKEEDDDTSSSSSSSSSESDLSESDSDDTTDSNEEESESESESEVN